MSNGYLTEKELKQISKWNSQQNPLKRVMGRDSICPTITARGAGEMHSGMLLYCPDFDNTTDILDEIRSLECKDE